MPDPRVEAIAREMSVSDGQPPDRQLVCGTFCWQMYQYQAANRVPWNVLRAAYRGGLK